MGASQSLPVRNPRTGEDDYKIAVDDAPAVAVKAARLRRAQSAWAAATCAERVAVMMRWAALIDQKYRSAIIEADSRDTGYGLISRIAPDMMLGVIRGLAASAERQLEAAMREGVSRANPNVAYRSVLKPFPVVGVISPWNAPTMLSMIHAIPPLFAGCAVLVKPSEVTPRFVEPLLASIAEIPELAAVFNFTLGDGATGAALVEAADYISFTGSVQNGRRVAEACARRLIPCDLELGGKDALIVLEDADLDDAVSAALRGAVTSTGQVCFSIERIYVHESVHDEFVSRLVARAQLIQINHPDPMSGQIGPFIGPAQAQIVDGHIDDALAKGARLIEGGKSFKLDGGDYMRPTVLVGVTHNMAVMREETFGPVMPVMRFANNDEAVRLANDSDYGLSAAVIGASEDEALNVAARVNAGNVSVQDSFLTFYASEAQSDSFGASGVAGGRHDLSRYLRRQALLINRAKPACLTKELLRAADQAAE